MSRMDAIRFVDPSSLGAPRATAAGTLANRHLFFVTALLFLLPNALFAVTALRPAPAALVLAGCAGVLRFIWRPCAGRLLSDPVDPARLASCLAVGLGLCLLGGQAHFFYAYSDWLVRDAVLADLVRDGASGSYRYDGQDYYLRAPLGMYMLPAAVGRVFGLPTAHGALLSTNAALFGSMLYIASAFAGTRAIVFLVVLVAFSGLDIVGGLVAQIASPETAGDLTSVEWWSRSFAPALGLQYSSLVTQLFWTPNHAAPGWFIAILVLLRSREEISLSTFVSCCAPLILWSPLAVLGAVPFGVLLAMRRPVRELIAADNLLAAATGLSFFPVALYLLTSSQALAHGWQAAADDFGRVYLLFLLIEMPQALILMHEWRRIEPADRGALVVAIVTLCLLPLYNFGPNNDLVLRASIPALFLIAFSFARIAASMSPRVGAFRVVWLVIFLSAATPASQLARPLTSRPFAVSDCNMLTIWQSTDPMGFPGNYLAPVANAPGWLLARRESQPPARLEYRDCWPDHPFRDLLRREAT